MNQFRLILTIASIFVITFNGPDFAKEIKEKIEKTLKFSDPIGRKS